MGWARKEKVLTYNQVSKIVSIINIKQKTIRSLQRKMADDSLDESLGDSPFVLNISLFVGEIPFITLNTTTGNKLFDFINKITRVVLKQMFSLIMMRKIGQPHVSHVTYLLRINLNLFYTLR